MNINEAIQEMIDSADYEVSFIGEQLWWHTESYISELEHLGFDPDEAVKGLVRFCKAVVAKVECGENVTFSNYREDLVALIAKHCHVGVKAAA